VTTAVVWFRRDLRLDDNPAWNDACGAAEDVVALYVLDPALFDTAGPFRRSALLAHLDALDRQLAELGGRLRVERGRPDRVVARVASEVEARSVHLNADATPYAVRRDAATQAAVEGAGSKWRPWWGTMVHRPGTVLTAKGDVSLVFTPFFRRWYDTEWDRWPRPSQATIGVEKGQGIPDGDRPPPDAPALGQVAAQQRLDEFCLRVDDYPDFHDDMAVDATSHLSVDLRWGSLSPRAVVSQVGAATPGRVAFVRQLAWRDWFAHLLASRPELRTTALKPEAEIAWRSDADGLAAWRAGRTGYPIVDAGMRQLAAVGWMHNRARMITASFLTKDLLVDWRLGERWFFHLLADGDVAQNVGNWQWAAGTGPDAAPYFRIFNPVTQSRRFDPDGTYIRRWVPELADVPAEWIHAPWDAPPLDLAAAGVVLGDGYPAPIVEHGAARERALAAYGATRVK
jgi:deoxyribodipyrimidine photo-lyase